MSQRSHCIIDLIREIYWGRVCLRPPERGWKRRRNHAGAGSRNSGSVPHLMGGDNMASGAGRCRLGEHLFLEWGWVLVYQQ